MIDDVDRQILTLLQENGRLSNAALAKEVGLTVSTGPGRVKNLERRGIIRGYVDLGDVEAMGKPITAFIRQESKWAGEIF